ncbi:hypothetical protein K437DRAFT_272668 [Tilletiaria anomala UBC 951]|uniref:Uncharacterized protein n=1 Tax=Tilletiaria anomala (strain ATCC 24038 / CBS 436.72 / UBC 951) TaxID=1037660 RepID=A0A066WEC3_TILAU|nr:uncharacterized protein K437DRAFT_272668 [Tilletiaria anomala UBC 951]KDN52126.1 hypothetical protein K437DRAFT_272668 [Tilletiaria anomala UBC 951]
MPSLLRVNITSPLRHCLRTAAQVYYTTKMYLHRRDQHVFSTNGAGERAASLPQPSHQAAYTSSYIHSYSQGQNQSQAFSNAGSSSTSFRLRIRTLEPLPVRTFLIAFFPERDSLQGVRDRVLDALRRRQTVGSQTPPYAEVEDEALLLSIGGFEVDEVDVLRDEDLIEVSYRPSGSQALQAMAKSEILSSATCKRPRESAYTQKSISPNGRSDSPLHEHTDDLAMMADASRVIELMRSELGVVGRPEMSKAAMYIDTASESDTSGLPNRKRQRLKQSSLPSSTTGSSVPTVNAALQAFEAAKAARKRKDDVVNFEYADALDHSPSDGPPSEASLHKERNGAAQPLQHSSETNGEDSSDGTSDDTSDGTSDDTSDGTSDGSSSLESDSSLSAENSDANEQDAVGAAPAALSVSSSSLSSTPLSTEGSTPSVATSTSEACSSSSASAALKATDDQPAVPKPPPRHRYVSPPRPVTPPGGWVPPGCGSLRTKKRNRKRRERAKGLATPEVPRESVTPQISVGSNNSELTAHNQKGETASFTLDTRPDIQAQPEEYHTHPALCRNGPYSDFEIQLPPGEGSLGIEPQSKPKIHTRRAVAAARYIPRESDISAAEASLTFDRGSHPAPAPSMREPSSIPTNMKITSIDCPAWYNQQWVGDDEHFDSAANEETTQDDVPNMTAAMEYDGAWEGEIEVADAYKQMQAQTREALQEEKGREQAAEPYTLLGAADIAEAEARDMQKWSLPLAFGKTSGFATSTPSFATDELDYGSIE